jgi:hypothetical protein
MNNAAMFQSPLKYAIPVISVTVLLLMSVLTGYTNLYQSGDRLS